MMGICVVYLVENADGYALMDLSVAQLKRCTRGAYRIYGCCPNNDAETLRRMAAHGIAVQDVGGGRPSHISQEHSQLLDLLVNQAVQDGCTQLATFDMDSWPILPNWDRCYTALLSEWTPVVSIVRTELGDNFPFAAFMCMQSAFWRPGESSFSTKLLLRASERAANLSSRPSETGSGILAQLYDEGRRFFRMERSNNWEMHQVIAGIYDNTIFHLAAGSRKPRFITDPKTYEIAGSALRRRFADALNATTRAFAMSEVLASHDQFIAALAGPAPLLPIETDPSVLPRHLGRTPLHDRKSWDVPHG